MEKTDNWIVLTDEVMEFFTLLPREDAGDYIKALCAKYRGDQTEIKPHLIPTLTVLMRTINLDSEKYADISEQGL